VWCNARWLRLEAAAVDFGKLGGGAVVNFDDPNKLTVTIETLFKRTDCCYVVLEINLARA
jgi:hypothetical protein